MATTAKLSVHYAAFEDCERVTIEYDGTQVNIFFESNEELATYLCGCGYPEWVKCEVFNEVTRHRFADQYEEVFGPPRSEGAAYTEAGPVCRMECTRQAGFFDWRSVLNFACASLAVFGLFRLLVAAELWLRGVGVWL